MYSLASQTHRIKNAGLEEKSVRRFTQTVMAQDLLPVKSAGEAHGHQSCSSESMITWHHTVTMLRQVTTCYDSDTRRRVQVERQCIRFNLELDLPLVCSTDFKVVLILRRGP
jgi:hypothetical protein